MRLYGVALLGVVALLAKANSISDVQGAAASFAAAELGISANRFLKVSYVTEVDNEERAGGIKSIPGVEAASTFVTKLRLAAWLRKNMNTDDVFAKLKLNAADDSIFENPTFLAWAKYVEKYNTNNPGQTSSMLPLLKKQYGDMRLGRILEAVKQADSTAESTRVLATNLQTEQMEAWKLAKLSTDTLFSMYKLNNGAVDLLDSPGMRIWIRYAEEFNPGPKTTLFDKLHASYSDYALSQLLILSKKVPSTEKLATSLQKEQLQKWLESGTLPQTVFKALMLNNEADNLFASSQFKIWLDYSMDFKKATPRAVTVPVIDTLKAHYSDAALSRIIIKAKRVSGTKTWATYYEQALVRKWVKDGKTSAFISQMLGRQVTPDEVFKLLKADMGTQNFLASKEFDDWVKYASVFKKENPDVTTKSVIDTLMAHYSDAALASSVKRLKETSATEAKPMYYEDVLLDKWAALGKDPAYVVNKLGTSKKEDNKKLLATYLAKLNRAISE